METGSFTIEFLEHFSASRYKVWLDLLKNKGARVEQQSERVFRIHCSNRAEIRKAGFLLLYPMRDDCNVIATTGSAEARASAYQIKGQHLRESRFRGSGSQQIGALEQSEPMPDSEESDEERSATS